MKKGMREWAANRSTERHLRSNKAKVIRQLKRKGMSNGEIKLYGPLYLKKLQGKPDEQAKVKWSPFRRAAALAEEKAYGTETQDQG